MVKYVALDINLNYIWYDVCPKDDPTCKALVKAFVCFADEYVDPWLFRYVISAIEAFFENIEDVVKNKRKLKRLKKRVIDEVRLNLKLLLMRHVLLVENKQK